MSSNRSPPTKNDTSESNKKNKNKLHIQNRKNAEWEGMNFFLNFPKIKWNNERNQIVTVGGKSIDQVNIHTLASCIKLFQIPIKKHEKSKNQMINKFTNLAKQVESGYYEDMNHFKDSYSFKPYLMFTLRNNYMHRVMSSQHQCLSSSPAITGVTSEQHSTPTKFATKPSYNLKSKVLMESSIIDILDSDSDIEPKKKRAATVSSRELSKRKLKKTQSFLDTSYLV